jgi:CHAD domain-containing protein
MAKPQPIEIASNTSAAIGIREVLQTRLEELCALSDRAVDAADIEGVHDMRVASRRWRSALRDFLPYLKRRPLTELLAQVKAIAAALGEVRDRDVAIVEMEKIGRLAPPAVGAGIDHIIQQCKDEREMARRTLSQVICSGTLGALKTALPGALDSALTASRRSKRVTPADTTSGLSYRDLTRNILLERLRAFERLGPSLYYPLKKEPLHRLRIEAKRFRYALELFMPCWTSDLRELAKKLAAMQTNLGGLHDCDVWLQRFGEDLEDIQSGRRSLTHPDQVAAAVWLLAYFVTARGRHYRRALTGWQDWQGAALGTRLRTILGERPATGDASTGTVTGLALPAAETSGNQ